MIGSKKGKLIRDSNRVGGGILIKYPKKGMWLSCMWWAKAPARQPGLSIFMVIF